MVRAGSFWLPPDRQSDTRSLTWSVGGIVDVANETNPAQDYLLDTIYRVAFAHPHFLFLRFGASGWT